LHIKPAIPNMFDLWPLPEKWGRVGARFHISVTPCSVSPLSPWLFHSLHLPQPLLSPWLFHSLHLPSATLVSLGSHAVHLFRPYILGQSFPCLLLDCCLLFCLPCSLCVLSLYLPVIATIADLSFCLEPFASVKRVFVIYLESCPVPLRMSSCPSPPVTVSDICEFLVV